MTKTDNEKYVRRGAGSMRRAAEGAFSAPRRAFGERVVSLGWESVIQKMRIRVAPYDKWGGESISRELERRAQHNGMKVILLYG